jgi:galactokinase
MMSAATLRGLLAQHYPEARRAVAADPASVRAIRAPGRVNLIGEHTDYNDGFVLPAAIDLDIRLAALATQDRRVEVMLLATGERAAFDLDDPGPRRGAWIDYIAGMAWSLREAGLPIHGSSGPGLDAAGIFRAVIIRGVGAGRRIRAAGHRRPRCCAGRPDDPGPAGAAR